MASTKISALTQDTAPDRGADSAPTYDASAVATKRVLLKDLGAYVLPTASWYNVSPADSTTYYLSPWAGFALATTAANHKIRIPRAGKVLAVYLDGLITGGGTTESSTVSFRLNDTTDTTISSTVTFNTSPYSFSNTALGISVAAGDYFNIKIATPAWVTNPTGVYMLATVYIA